MKKKLTLIVDGNSLLKQSYHGNSNMYSNDGNHLGALYTVITIIRKLIVEQKPNRVLVCWDGDDSGKLRYDLPYPLYKANRGKNFSGGGFREITLNEAQEKESIMRQRNRIVEYCEELYIRQVSDQYTEADDLIAYYCNVLKDPNEEVLIYSNDRDYVQIVTEEVGLYLANKKSIVHSTTHFLFYDYHYSNAALIKAIEGCTSDNIIGYSGIKEKSLLEYFPELKKRKVEFKEILENSIKINEERKIKKLKPLKALENIINGVPKRDIMLDEIKTTEQLFNINYKLVDLKNPIITDEAIEALEDIKEIPLDDTDRGAKNLLRMMVSDGFIDYIPGKKDGFIDYILPFNTVVKEEKKILEIYNNKKT